MPKPVDALIARTPLRAGEELRVTMNAFRGQQYIHARRYYEKDGRWLPGKGLAVRVDLLPWLLDALRYAESAGLDAGLLELEDYEGHGLTLPSALEEAA
jgi:hypothetical protein